MPPAVVHHVPVVTGEQLIPSVTRQHDLHVLPRETRDEVGRDRGWIGKRLIEGAQEVIQHVEVLGTDDELVVLCPEPLCDSSRIGELVVRFFPEAHGERLDRDTDLGRHDRDDGARIDSPAQEGADRHVADEVRADCVLQEGPQ